MTRPLLLPVLLLLAVAAPAQDEDLPPDEAEDLVQLYVERGEESLRDGDYDEARLRFQKALRRDPAHRGARLGIAACFRAVGGYEEAEAQIRELLARTPGDREARVTQAELD
ncbi:MAG: tetratricopeptide repeat protein, partial [Planctomycetota bacterium]